MLLIPAGLAALVALYCLACVLHPGWRNDGGRVGVDLGHAVMGVTTAAMLLDVLPASWAPGALVVFGSAIVGCTVRGLRPRPGRAGYLRLGVLSAAMMPMLVPAPAGATSMLPGAAHAMSTGPASPAAGSHQPMASAANITMPSAGRVIDLLVIAALLALTAARLAGTSRPGQSLHCRLHAVCDVAMAATTGCMIAAML